MKTAIHYSIVFVLLCIAEVSKAQNSIYFEMLPGAAYTLPSQLTVQQEGYEDIVFRATYKTEPFKLPIYYSLRTGYYLQKDVAIEIELNHHKVFLVNNPDEIQQFSITHGYNQLWFNVLKEFHHLGIRTGIGPVLAHPENTVRGNRLPQNGGLLNNGYYIHGLTSQLAMQYRIYLSRFIFLTAETKVNISYSKTIVVNGHASMWVNSFHALAGVGLEL